MHSVFDALGECLHLVRTAGEVADSPQLPALLVALSEQPGAEVADKAYDTNHVLDVVTLCEAKVFIPNKTNRLDQYAYDETLYADCNRIERFFGQLKEARGLATRYGKTAASIVAVAHLLAALY